jgi:hypothetical protein
MRIFAFAAALCTAPLAHAESLADLSWLKGCWRTQGPGPEITEVWIAPPLPALLGFSYTVGEGETQGWEQTRIDVNGDGRPIFVAMPSGNPPVTFDIIEDDTPNIVAFENPAHDYPKRVEYAREGDVLRARISGGGDPIGFVYHRIACPAELLP